MIEATCSACGTLNRVSEANVPVGAKFITCADCKSRMAIPAVPGAAPPPTRPPDIPAAARPSNVVDLTDLPTPKRGRAQGPLPSPPQPRPATSRPSERGVAAAIDSELPVPRAARAPGPSPAPVLDFNGPAATAADDGGIDLPAPKRPSQRSLTPNPAHGVVDLPAPKAERSLTDLPAPKRDPRAASAARPAPKDRAPPATQDPKPSASPPRPAPRGAMLADLPAPRAQGVSSRPSDHDLPAPKGFFDDLPQPAQSQPDLPAPKGFFDDLPQPAQGQPDLPAPKGFFDDLPQPAQGQPDLPAPKGFFDDLPQVKAHPSGEAPDVPAPMGYFDDVPGLPLAGRPGVPGPQGQAESVRGRPIKRTREPAPRGFFDDLEPPARPGPPAPAQATGLSDPDLELVSPTAADSLDDLDLSTPGSPVRFDPGSRTAPARPSVAVAQATYAGPLIDLEEAPTRAAVRPVAPQPAAARLVSDAVAGAERPPSVGRASDTAADAEHPPKAKRVSNTVTIPRPRPRRQLLLGGLFAVVLVGGGGFVMYRRHVAAVARHAEIAEQLDVARKAHAATDAQHWRRAAMAARRVVNLDSRNPEALGIGAEALLASALDDGIAAGSKIAQAHAMLDAARRGGISSPEIARARALAALAARRPDDAIAQLQPLADQEPHNPVLALYLGWAVMAKGDARTALQAYDRAAGAEAVKLPALYGRGGARLALGDLEGARADFTAVLALANDHLGAQVGRAAAQPSSAAQRREADLLAILSRKDIAGTDPRVVAQAWTLAGDAARRAGRYDVARERFRKALAARPQDLGATTGLAETELRDGKVLAAAEQTALALGVARDYVPAQLVQSEIEIKQHKLPLATQRLTALASRAIPLTPLEQARLQLVTGKLLDAQGKDDEAASAYVAGAKAARELDLEPMLAAVGKLAAMTKAALADRDWRRAGVLRGRADELLGGFADQAQRDPQLALTLGVGYLQAGDAVKAEQWLRRATRALPEDAEAWFQLGRALNRSEKRQAALEALNTAFTFDPTSADIGADLAHTYEVLGRDSEADALYTNLLAGPEPSLELRARSGRFFARTGERDKADEQGRKILAADPHHPAGYYLKGEGLLVSGKPLEAKQQFQRAVAADPDPQYLDALGRAAEALAQGGDRDAYDLALRSYQSAAEAAPDLLNPLVGQGRLYVARHEAARAVPPLLAAARIDPKNAEVMSLIGAAYQELQQPAMALQWLEGATRIAPIAEAYWRIGQIERDANHGRRAMAALASATRLASESEQRDGKRVAWLTDALYLEGRVSFDLDDNAAARHAWIQYRDRNPPDSAQLTEVKRLLATSLQN